MTLKIIEITTVRLVFDDEPKEAKSVNVSKNEEIVSEKREKISKRMAKVSEKPKAVKQTKSGRHMWTDDEKKEAMQMYADGEDLEVIAKRFSSTKMSILKIMQKAGVKRPWPTKGNPSKLASEDPETEENEPV